MTKTPLSELDDLFDELDQLLKNPDVGSELAAKGINASLAMTLAYGLRAYVHGDKQQALLELGTATEEIAARMGELGAHDEAVSVLMLPHPAPLSGASYSAVELMPGDREVVLLDQRKLPGEESYVRLSSVEEVATAIETMVVRGAPAIGIAAAYGVVLAAGDDAGIARLGRTRPTAVNLAWALARMGKVARDATLARRPVPERVERLASEARAIHREDVAACRAIGRVGAVRVPDGATILTHCNAGALATGGYGTALGVVRAAREAGKRVRVVACETRPWLQGARLTAWELVKDGFDVTVVVDSSAAQRMRAAAVDVVVVGADRIARSGDVANKIGTYALACLAQVHGVPFYVAAPFSTVDLSCPDGQAIPIERRSDREILFVGDVRVAPQGVRADNPAFDVTPASLVRAVFTERGEVSPPCASALNALNALNALEAVVPRA